MWSGGSPAYGVLVGLLIVLHFGLRPLFTAWPGSPDLLLGALLLGSLRLRAGYAAVLGFLLGLLEGAMALGGMGTLMIVYALVGYLTARSRDVLFSDSRTFVPLFLFAGVWAVHLVQAALSDAGPSFGYALGMAPLAALGTALVCWVADRAVAYVMR